MLIKMVMVEFSSRLMVQSKLTKSQDYLQSVYNYLDGKDGLDDKFQKMIKLKEILKELRYVCFGSIKTTHKMSVPSIGYSTPEAKEIYRG